MICVACCNLIALWYSSFICIFGALPDVCCTASSIGSTAVSHIALHVMRIWRVRAIYPKECKEWKIDLDDTQKCLPYMYWVPKMHKNPSKQRFIAASARCSTKQLSATITKCLKQADTYHAKTGKQVYSNSGINSYWIIGNSSKVHRMIDRSNERKNVENIATYDFSTLYTNIPHDKLKTRMESVTKRKLRS